MKTLSKEKTREVITALYNKLGRQKPKEIDKLVNSKLFKLGFFQYRRSVPDLWSSNPLFNSSVKKIYESVVTFNNYESKEREIFIPKIIQHLKYSGIKDCFIVGNLFINDNFEIAASLSTEQIADIQYGDEYYLFDDTIDWLFTHTHEGFSFLAGNKKFMDEFKKSFPDYQKYEINEPFLD